ncbi:MAG: hypothetical protein ABIS50_17350 [Luteolibacter sp.]|uniref:hypothetical protein n=1 Tax=Luteolibacter sp. TaxID=1962973 RepID=UPI0032643759
MKTNLIYAAVVGGALCVGFLMNTEKVAAAAAPGSDPGAPPIGKLVDVTVITWPLSTQPAFKINGTLIAMQPNWLVVNEGNYDHWIPTDKVMDIKAAK